MKPQTILALGDSYTIGEAVTEAESYPVIFYKRLLHEGIPAVYPEVIARTGWTTTDLLNRISETPPNQIPYDIIFLLIGVNNQYQKKSGNIYIEDFKLLCEKAISFAAEESRIVTLSIPDYAHTPFGLEKGPGISEEINWYNEINKRISDDFGFTYVNITDITRRGLEWPELVAEDNLHPSGVMYELWVDRIMSQVKIKMSAGDS